MARPRLVASATGLWRLEWIDERYAGSCDIPDVARHQYEVVVVPLTGHDRGLVTQPRIAGPQSGLRQASFARPEDMRAIDAGRLQRRLGHVSNEDLAEIRKVMRYFLDL